MFHDVVRVNDAGRILINRKEAFFWGREESVIEVRGWVRTLCRERGKIVPGSYREGKNIWTNTGREFSAMLQTYQPGGQIKYRSDGIAYLGVGIGLQTEDVSVTSLTQPVPYISGVFLSPIDHNATSFPLSPTRTTVRYSCTFAEDQLTFGATSSILISELGLFTDGNPSNGWAVGQPPTGRATDIASASQQAPCAYKALPEAVEKTSALEFEVDWEIRY
jgi:hypothetical protein